MRRWTSMLGAMLLVLLLWTGVAAQASSPAEPGYGHDHGHEQVEGWAAAEDHADQEPGAIHYHDVGDTSHSLAALSEAKPLVGLHEGAGPSFHLSSDWLAGDGPGLTLRPPIA